MVNIRNKTRDIITDPAEIKMIIRAYYRQLYTHTFDNLNKMYKFFEKHKN